MPWRNASASQSAALESTADGVIITEPDGTITWVNPAFTRMTGWSAAEAIGRKPSILRSGQHDNAIYHKLWQTLLDGQVWDGELTNRRKDGQLRRGRRLMSRARTRGRSAPS